MKRFSSKKGMIVLAVLACALVGYYIYLSERPIPEYEAPEEGVEVMTKVQSVLSRNLETNYPPTPKEVVKYFSDITKCFYNEEYTEDELVQLARKIREIYDDDLLATQTEEKYMEELKEDIKEYKEKNRKIFGYETSSSIDVVTSTHSGYEWATLHCIYSIKESVIVKSDTEFLLRKDEDGHYKIYGWRLAEEDE